MADCNVSTITSHSFMDVNKFNPHEVELFATHTRGLSGLYTCISLHKVYTY